MFSRQPQTGTFLFSLTLAFVCLAGGSEILAQDAPRQPPEIPVGYDAYRQWDKWPLQRIGAMAYMRSTYDRRGGNESADASHFLYQLAEDNNVTLDVMGEGMLYFARYNHWHGSPWHYEVDGQDHIVQETTTANPLRKLDDAVFMPESAFPSPLTATYATTKGADLSWVPIGFHERFRMGYSRTYYGTGYYIYHHYLPGAELSQPIESWDPGQTPPEDVLALLQSAGSDISPVTPVKASRPFELAANSTEGIFSLQGAGSIRALMMSFPRDDAIDFGHVRLRITWDDRELPSVDAPIALFFGAGTLYNRDDSEYLVKALPVNIRYTDENVELACYFPMPHWKSVKIELVNDQDRKFQGTFTLSDSTQQPSRFATYFHATYRDHAEPQPGHDNVFLDTDEVEGGGPWSGNFVGTSFIFSDRGYLGTLEGDPRFFFDDSQTPQAYGTGTEEWGGGGDYWGGRTMTLPLAGHPVGVPRAERDARDVLTSQEENIESAYRFLLADLMPFGKRAVIRFEHGGENTSTEHYQSVTYWYGSPQATLVRTDVLNVGDAASEADHNYVSPDASDPEEITSRYEWGPDHVAVNFDTPVAEPADYADFEFVADAGTYNIWLRGMTNGGNRTDATWFQFDEHIGTDQRSASGIKGFGNWRDTNARGEWSWSSELPQNEPVTITFDQAGMHKLRVQRRDGGHVIEKIWLSKTQAERPDADFAPQNSTDDRGEIVLAAADATSTAGGVKVVSRENRQLLEIGPEGSHAEIEVYPAQTMVGRRTTGASEFTLQLREDNYGVLLRRTLDYRYPNQRAKVYVADAASEEADWQPAGTWYLAGSNTCYYSYPRQAGELGKTNPVVQTSNRRFRDDEFLLPRALTQGRQAIRVRVEFEPLAIPLLPGRAVDELAWSEIAYQAYCWVLPTDD